MVGVSRTSSKLAPESLYEYALRVLGRRPHTSAELRAKLARRSAEERAVAAVISRLRDNGYVMTSSWRSPIPKSAVTMP